MFRDCLINRNVTKLIYAEISAFLKRRDHLI